jgi:cell division protease FtsH
MEKHYRFSIWYVLLGIWVVLLVHNLIFSALAVKMIPYSKFLDYVKEGKVAELAITANQIQGRLKDEVDGMTQGTAFRTVRVDPEISELLANQDITFKGEIESTFFRNILSWVVPIFFFVGVWYLLMRRIMGQQQGFMTLGKNKAKIYSEEDVEVRFDDVAGVDEAKQELVEVIEFLKQPEQAAGAFHSPGRENAAGHSFGGASRKR